MSALTPTGQSATRYTLGLIFRWLRRWRDRLLSTSTTDHALTAEPVKIPRDQHPISRKNISRAALKVLYGLHEAGFQALLVGGGVRDQLLGMQPKDFDVATDASPEQVKAVFRRCRLIGRRFRLAHVRFGDEIIEVATFRAAPRTPDEGEDDNSADGLHEQDDSGRILRDNVYGNLEQDAVRRDFTINALYYDIADFSIVDHVGGMADLEQRRLRLIGDPETRYREDPVRMLRAMRFAAKLDFNIDPAAAKPIASLRPLLLDVPPARIFDELQKMLLCDHAQACFAALVRYDMLALLLPPVAALLDQPKVRPFIDAALASTESRIRQNKPVSPAFLLACMLWFPMLKRQQQHLDQGLPPMQALSAAADEVFAQVLPRVAVPRRFSAMVNEIWHLQHRFHQRRGKRPYRLLEHKRYRAAWDFLELRAEVGDAEAELPGWWDHFANAQGEDRSQLQEQAGGSAEGAPSRRRRRRRRKPRGGANTSES
nr:polynucleotide adenylyltransferase PcnB [Oceanococcus sp. HetDA_MAG_MS8]